MCGPLIFILLLHSFVGYVLRVPPAIANPPATSTQSTPHLLLAAQAPAPPEKIGGSQQDAPTRLSQAKDVTEIVKSAFTVLGILVGGFWTYMLFVRKREKYPRAKITHSVTHNVLPGDHRLLHVVAIVTNVGGVLLSLESGITRVQQMLPVPPEFLNVVRERGDPIKEGDTEYLWPSLGERRMHWEKNPRELEPGENEEIHYDFVIDSEATRVEIYSYFKNTAKHRREIGWHLTTLYNLKKTRLPTDSTENQPRHRPG